MSKELQILQLTADGKSQRMIAKMLRVSRNTISSVQTAAIRSDKAMPELLRMEEPQLIKVLFPEKELIPVQVKPDFEWIHKELLKDDVTLQSLWEEYCDQCREAKMPPYMYSQFCKLYSDYVNQHRLTMHINHKPGDKLMVTGPETNSITTTQTTAKSSHVTCLLPHFRSVCCATLKHSLI